ncbi:hypothetical protein E4U45_006358 [Claviceps purpurea]|nr:hypothetical protein E4U45_006358 [Claviceps purpurea]
MAHEALAPAHLPPSHNQVWHQSPPCHSPRLVFILDTPPSAPVYRQSHDQGIKPSQYLEIGSLFRWQSSSTNPSTTSPDDTSGWNSLLRFVILSNSMRLFCPSLDLTTAFGLSKSLVQCRFLDCGPAWIVRHATVSVTVLSQRVSSECA